MPCLRCAVLASRPALVTLAEERDAFRAEGAEVVPTTVASPREQLVGLVEGRWDIAVTPFDSALDWGLDGQGEVVIVAQIETTAPLALYTRPSVESYRDLRARTVACELPASTSADAGRSASPFSGASARLLRRLLTERGLTPDTYMLQPEPGPEAALEALIHPSEEIAAALLPPALEPAAEAYGLRLLGRVHDLWPGYPGAVLVARGPRGESLAGPGALVAYLRALINTGRWARRPESRDTALAILRGLGRGRPREAALHEYEGMRPNLGIDPAGIRALLALRRDAGLPIAPLHEVDRRVKRRYLSQAAQEIYQRAHPPLLDVHPPNFQGRLVLPEGSRDLAQCLGGSGYGVGRLAWYDGTGERWSLSDRDLRGVLEWDLVQENGETHRILGFAAGDRPDALTHLCRLSDLLTARGVVHRLELTERESPTAAYHHGWPSPLR